MQKSQTICLLALALLITPGFAQRERASDRDYSGWQEENKQQSKSAASKDSKNAPVTTLKSTSRLIVVDVVVTDTDGNLVKNLEREDFKLIEDGKQQNIFGFEAHTSPVEAEPVARPHLAANEYTNAVPVGAENAITIVLLDGLNTPFADQSSVRRQFLNFLKTLPSGHRVAVFTLGTKLRMVQGLTSSPAALLAAVEKITATQTPLLTSAIQTEGDAQMLAEVAAVRPQVAAALTQFLAEDQTRNTDVRVENTLNALEQIAHATAAFPGRKNLVWLSGAFPLSINPSFGLPDPYNVQRSYGAQVQRLAALLAASKIAVYPVDARGLVYGGAGGSTPIVMGRANGAGGQLVDAAVGSISDTHATMRDIAEKTGGKAFVNTNDLKTSIARSIELGSSYYTLSYVPPQGKWDGSFRRITVKLDRKNATLAYRRGYYAVDESRKLEEKQLNKDMETAMSRDALDASDLLFRARLQPPDASGKLLVTYKLNPRALSTRDVDNSPRDLQMDFVTLGWDANGNSTGHIVQQVKVPAKGPNTQRLEQDGYTFEQELVLKPGTKEVCVGVLDRNTGKIGTIHITL